MSRDLPDVRCPANSVRTKKCIGSVVGALFGCWRLLSRPALLALSSPLSIAQSPTLLQPTSRQPSAECANVRRSARAAENVASYSVAPLPALALQRFPHAARPNPFRLSGVRARFGRARPATQARPDAPGKELPTVGRSDVFQLAAWRTMQNAHRRQPIHRHF